MTAPSATARTSPSGRYFEDGYQTLITFAADADVQLWEKTVKPPGYNGGDEIDVTTMHNTALRTKAPRALIDMTNGSITCGYKGTAYAQTKALINVETTITVTFPNGSTLAFYGYLKNFDPGDHSEGAMPEASCEFVCTNRDPTTGEEEAAVYTAATGTGT